MGRHAAQPATPETPVASPVSAQEPEAREELGHSGLPKTGVPQARKVDEKLLTVSQAAFAADMRPFDRAAYFTSLCGAAVAFGSIIGLIVALVTTGRGGFFVGTVIAVLVAVGGYFHARKQEKLRKPGEEARFGALRDAINRTHGLRITSAEAETLIRGGSVISTGRRNTAILHLLHNEHGARKLFEAELSAVPELQVPEGLESTEADDADRPEEAKP